MFWIDGADFPLQSAELVAEVDVESRRVSFSLYVEAKESETGMSLSGISAPGTSAAGLVVRLSDDTNDEFNDLSQSEVNLRGEAWKVRSFFLRLGAPREDRISIDLTATCEASGRQHQVRLAGDAEFSLESERI